ncbi:MAG TPA: tetratricopeptide repeat protein [Polyangia bacterium]|nr:tetratricopeptide repeat protein [Polyangia bacterium]
MTLASLAALAGALMAVGPTAPVPVQPAAREAFARGRTAFDRAEYQRAIEILHPLLYPEVVLDSEGEVVQAHRMLGVAYLFENNPDEARREFKKLLELRPDYRFDPLLDPQRVVDFFNGVLKEEEATIADILAKRRQRENHPKPPPITPPPTILRYERHSYTVNFIPFGAGQFQNGQRGKGWFFFGTEAALAAVSVAAFTTNFALYGLSPHRRCNVTPPAGVLCDPQDIDHSQEDRSRALLDIQLVSGGLFFAVAIWGVIDAIRNHQPEVLLPDESGGGGKITRRPTSGARFTLLPDGLGAAWTF